LNIYPGLLKLGPFKPGFFMGVNRDDTMIFGINLMHVPLGLATGREPTH
jgi:hypothetical protein